MSTQQSIHCNAESLKHNKDSLTHTNQTTNKNSSLYNYEYMSFQGDFIIPNYYNMKFPGQPYSYSDCLLKVKSVEKAQFDKTAKVLSISLADKEESDVQVAKSKQYEDSPAKVINYIKSINSSDTIKNFVYFLTYFLQILTTFYKKPEFQGVQEEPPSESNQNYLDFLKKLNNLIQTQSPTIAYRYKLVGGKLSCYQIQANEPFTKIYCKDVEQYSLDALNNVIHDRFISDLNSYEVLASILKNTFIKHYFKQPGSNTPICINTNNSLVMGDLGMHMENYISNEYLEFVLIFNYKLGNIVSSITPEMLSEFNKGDVIQEEKEELKKDFLKNFYPEVYQNLKIESMQEEKDRQNQCGFREIK